MNMEGWVLLGADKQEVPVIVYPGQDLVEADLSDVPDVYQDLHWHAPKTYLGDKVRDEGRLLERFNWKHSKRKFDINDAADGHNEYILTIWKTQSTRNIGGFIKICAFEFSAPLEDFFVPQR